MKKILLTLLLIILPLSAAAEAGKRESIKELLELINADSMIDTIYSQMDQMFAGMGSQLGVSASEQELFNNYTNKVEVAMKEEMSWAKMEAPIIDVYINNYTEEEIQDMLRFYRSKTGRSMIEKMPEVMVESMAVSQKMLEEFMPKFMELAKELEQEVKAHREQK